MQKFPFSRTSFESILLEQGLITADQLYVAKEEKKKQAGLLGEILVDLNFLEPQQLQKALSQATGLPCINLNEILIESHTVALFPLEDLKKYQALPFAYDKVNQILHLAMADPEHIVYRDKLKKIFQESLKLCPKIQFYHADPQQIQAILHQTSPAHVLLTHDDNVARVDMILTQAIKRGVSDIHFQPEDQSVTVRYRIDGMLKTVQTFHKKNWSGVSVRLKIMSSLDIAEVRRPQSGRFDCFIAGHQVDFRLSTHPTLFGENIVIRLLDKNKSLLRLTDLGFSEDHINYLKKISSLSQGLILVSGPTGSGKTTTLYGLFAEMDTNNRNIMTLEEPVEYQLSGVRQTEIKEGGVINFSEGVRSILRQDPDVIFIGEIRDEATAKMALRSAMTGHLVIATIHSYDCFGVPARLIDLGLQPSLVAGHIICAISQKLIRKVCSLCQQKGCEDCDQTGYKGRCAIVEILPFDDTINHIIAQGGSRTLIKNHCEKNLQKSLWQDGQDKVTAGITTVSELERVLGSAEFNFSSIP